MILLKTPQTQAFMQLARSLRLFIMSFAILIKSGTAQETKKFVGDYLAVSGPIHVRLHLLQTGDSVTGTLDSPDFRVAGLPLTDIRISGQNLSFSVPTIKGAWTGVLERRWELPFGNVESRQFRSTKLHADSYPGITGCCTLVFAKTAI